MLSETKHSAKHDALALHGDSSRAAFAELAGNACASSNAQEPAATSMTERFPCQARARLYGLARRTGRWHTHFLTPGHVITAPHTSTMRTFWLANAARVTRRPIRPKPLIPMRISAMMRRRAGSPQQTMKSAQRWIDSRLTFIAQAPLVARRTRACDPSTRVAGTCCGSRMSIALAIDAHANTNARTGRKSTQSCSGRTASAPRRPCGSTNNCVATVSADRDTRAPAQRTASQSDPAPHTSPSASPSWAAARRQTAITKEIHTLASRAHRTSAPH